MNEVLESIESKYVCVQEQGKKDIFNFNLIHHEAHSLYTRTAAS